MSDRLSLREAINVPDALNRDRLVSRIREIRSGAVLDKSTLEHWNATHLNEQPFDTAFEDSVIAWCDGKGPLPTVPPLKDGQ